VRTGKNAAINSALITRQNNENRNGARQRWPIESPNAKAKATIGSSASRVHDELIRK
jgi:hypothetical protein